MFITLLRLYKITLTYLAKQSSRRLTTHSFAFSDDLDSEFGASPLGKAAGRGGADVAAVDELPGGLQTASGAAPLPDIYGDLYGDTGEGNLLLKTQVAQVRTTQIWKYPSTAFEYFFLCSKFQSLSFFLISFLSALQLTNQCRQQEHLIQQLQEQLETLTNEVNSKKIYSVF